MSRTCKAVLAVLLGVVASGAHSQTPLTVEVFDRAVPGFAPDNNWQTKWIQGQVKKELGIDVKFVTVPRGQEIDKLNLLMAAGQAPDLCFTYNQAVVTGYVKAAGLTDLTKLLPKLAPEVMKYTGSELLQFGQWGGCQWAIPAKRLFSGAFSGFIRKDWLDRLGLKVPTTIEEFYGVLKAFKEKDPGGVGQEHVIPFSLTVDPGNIHWTSALIWEAFRKQNPEVVDASSERWSLPGSRDAVKFLNRLFNEGLLAPNFAFDRDGSQYLKGIVQGNVGVAMHSFDFLYRDNPGIEAELEKNIPGAKFVPFDLQNNETKRYSKWKYDPNGLFVFIPRFSRNSEAALKYLNWLVRPEVSLFLQNGIKGVHYTAMKGGIPTGFRDQKDLVDEEKWNPNDYTLLVNGRELGSTEKNLEALSLGYTGFETLVRDSMEVSLRDSYLSFRFNQILDTETKYRQVLNAKGAEIFVRSITVKSQNFGATYDALLKDYMASGGSEIEAEKRRVYQTTRETKVNADLKGSSASF